MSRSSQVVTDPPAGMRVGVAVVGAGPGGAITACLLAEAGRDVLLVEDGPYLELESCPAFSREEMTQKYRNGGVTVAMGSPKVAYVEGRCVGGGSEINSGLYHRTPPDVLAAWRRAFGVEALTDEDLAPHFAFFEQALSVSPMPPGTIPPASRKLQEGAARLGWRALEVPRWYRYATTDGGPPRGVRQSMTKTFVPRALAAGCRLLPHTRALRLQALGGRWIVRTRHAPEGSPPRGVTIDADTVFLCAGAVQTPTLLRRSGIRRHVGDALRMHPTVKMVARFDETVNAPDMGVPTHQVKEFAPRYSFGCSISSSPYLALAMTDHPSHAPAALAAWEQCAIYYAMTGGGAGRVRPVPAFADPLVHYQLSDPDLVDLAAALADLARCLLAAGARELFPSIRGGPVLRGEGDLAALPAALPRATSNLMTIHLVGSCPMGEGDTPSATDSFGRVHGVPGLRCSDASLLCGPPGVNPQGTIMALARRNALQFLERR